MLQGNFLINLNNIILTYVKFVKKKLILIWFLLNILVSIFFLQKIRNFILENHISLNF